jgi:hypothetical protein
VELKTDFYDMSETPNFFFERWSDRDKAKPGGPWQALLNGSEWFVYFFIKNDCAFWFETDKLVNELERITAKLKLVDIVNVKWVTQGFRVPRAELKDIAVEQKIKEPEDGDS